MISEKMLKTVEKNFFEKREEMKLIQMELEKISDSNSNKASQYKKRLKKLEIEMQKIIEYLSAEPNYNKYLKDSIEEKYDEKIKRMEFDIKQNYDAQEAFDRELQEGGSFYSVILEIRNKGQKIISDFTDTESKKNLNSGAIELEKMWKSFESKIKSDKRFENIILTENDKIALTYQFGEEYKISFFKVKHDNMTEQKQELQSKKEKVLHHLDTIKLADKKSFDENKNKSDILEVQNKINEEYEKNNQRNIRLSELDELIKQSEANILKLESSKQKIIRNSQSIERKKNELKRLENKIDPEIQNKSKETKKELQKVLRRLKRKGYISEDTVPELKNKESETGKLFKEFIEADKKVRKIFFKCKTGEFSVEDEEELKNAIEEYRTISSNLCDLTGTKTADWNKYLLRLLSKRLSRGKEIDPIYFNESINIRFENLKSQYQEIENSRVVASKYQSAKNRLEILNKLEQKVLLDEKYEVSDILNNTERYKNSMSRLASSLKISRNDLFDSLKYDIMQKVDGFLAKIKNFVIGIVKGKENFKPDIKYSKDTNKLIQEKNKLKRDLANTNREKREYIKNNFSEDEKNQYRKLRSMKLDNSSFEDDVRGYNMQIEEERRKQNGLVNQKKTIKLELRNSQNEINRLNEVVSNLKKVKKKQTVEIDMKIAEKMVEDIDDAR